MKQLFLICIMLTFSATIYAQQSLLEKPDSISKIYHIDKDDFAILIFEQKNYPQGCSPSNLSKLELSQIDTILSKRVGENIEKNIKLSEYKFQFKPWIAKNGDKNVFINGFCKDYFKKNDNLKKTWKKEMVNVKGGDKCFFTAVINLSTKRCSSFNVK